MRMQLNRRKALLQRQLRRYAWLENLAIMQVCNAANMVAGYFAPIHRGQWSRL